MEKTSIKLAPQPSMAAMVETLHAGGYSLVVSNGGSAFAFVGRGVSDLFRLLSTAGIASGRDGRRQSGGKRSGGAHGAWRIA